MNRIAAAAAYVAADVFWTPKFLPVAAMAGVMSVTVGPVAERDRIWVVIILGVFAALDTVAWFLDREYQRRADANAEAE